MNNPTIVPISSNATWGAATNTSVTTSSIAEAWKMEVKDITEIKGKMVMVEWTMSESIIAESPSPQDLEEYVKKTLAQEITRKLMDQRLISFTRAKDSKGLSDVFRARCFVTPDETTRLLFKHGVK